VRQGAVAAPCRQQDLARAQTVADRHGDPVERTLQRRISALPDSLEVGGDRLSSLSLREREPTA